MKDVSDLLRDYQYQNHYSQHDMAKFLGIAQSTYNNWVNGQSVINPVKYYEKIANLCGVDIKTINPQSHKLEAFFVKNDKIEFLQNALELCQKYVKNLEKMNDNLRRENERMSNLLNLKLE
jgi:transcriptional regulator with XRE-family HTH domain